MGRFNSTFTPATAGTTPVANPQPAAPQQHVVVTPATVGTKPAAPVQGSSPAPAPQQPAAPALPKANTRTAAKPRHEYVAPKDAIEAKQRIEEAIAKNRVSINDTDADPITFSGSTYGYKDCFRMLGGDFDKTKSLWFVPRAAWLNPATATATKSEAMLRKEKEEADREADVQRRIQEAIEADRRLRPAATPEGMMTIEEAKNRVVAAILLCFANIMNTPREQIMTQVEQIFSNRK